jgi:hypothetical protein
MESVLLIIDSAANSSNYLAHLFTWIIPKAAKPQPKIALQIFAKITKFLSEIA